MMLPDAPFQLPRYCRRKALKSGQYAYFFEPPTWARKQGCHVRAEALGTEYAAARDRAEQVLLPAFDSWRSRGLTDMAPPLPVPGTFDWLACIFKSHQKWKEIGTSTQRCYDQGLSLFANHILKDGRGWGRSRFQTSRRDSLTQFTLSSSSWTTKTQMAPLSSANAAASQTPP